MTFLARNSNISTLQDTKTGATTSRHHRTCLGLNTSDSRTFGTFSKNFTAHSIYLHFCRSLRSGCVLPSGVDICVLWSYCWVDGWSSVFVATSGTTLLEGDSRKEFSIGGKLDCKLWGEFWCLIYVILTPRQC